MGFLIFFITIISIATLYFWLNKDDKGRYVALVTIIVLLLVSSVSIHKYQETKSNLYWTMNYNYDEFIGGLNLSVLGDSQSEQNVYFKRYLSILRNRAIVFDTIGETTPISSFFTSQSMKEVFPEIIGTIYAIDLKIREEDYSLGKDMIEALSMNLSEIGNILGTNSRSMGYNNFGIMKVRIDYEENKISRVKELVDEIKKILDE